MYASFHKFSSYTLCIICSIFSFFYSSVAMEKTDYSVNSNLTARVSSSPSYWLQKTENTLMNFESKLIGGQDTAFLKEEAVKYPQVTRTG